MKKKNVIKKEEKEKQDEIKKINAKSDSMIWNFDNKIKEFDEFISEEEEFSEAINQIIKNTEYDLGEFINNKKTDKEDNIFAQPPLLFKSNKFINKGSWDKDGFKEGSG